ncbi:lasso peptide biosynthesis B2 protein [Kibdelosporangium aridum]|uniref:lasso peptide biosynthesis B2 protein n=1 Tax=Kibdelosporangium aridum TaxID=2030 RepID=UPI001C8CD21A|nr:lasso peptide biosynthesis B2 protein [Kibdelosporangium aridum]
MTDRPATYEQAKAARDDVVAVSMICGAREGCVPRSLATVLLCRLYHDTTPTWCVGCRRVPPFGAHAWVQADDIAVDEATHRTISARCSRCHDADGAHRAGGESHAVPSAAQ